MRHGKTFNHLGRTASHRKALLKNMAISLIEHKKITTTLAKAKELRKYVEPLITKSKNDSTHSRRTVFSYLQSKEALKELFGVIADRVGDRPGGYTRILKIGNRPGDNAEMAFIELVDFSEFAPGKASGSSKRKKRRRKTGSGTGKETVATPVVEKPVANDVIEDAQEVIETPEEETAQDSEQTSEER
ncbi:MAG: 50S ribosomal protein L17 [Bacteroidia bacterium]|nr:50S ribosomal protein L17 [Bacteroidia bacterium]